MLLRRSVESRINLAETSVRVEMKQLNELISTAGELYRQTSNALVTLGATPKAEAVAAAGQNLRGRFVELEERLIKLRLVPIGEVLERAAARAGRIAARQMGKEVEFEIAGGDVGIEKSSGRGPGRSAFAPGEKRDHARHRRSGRTRGRRARNQSAV
mgnify:CR=1 FL=1